MDRYWLVLCDEKGNKINKDLPKDMPHNYVALKPGESLPRIGEKLEVIVDVEPNGDDDGRFEFRIRDIKHTILQFNICEKPSDNSSYGYPEVYVQRIE